MPHHGSITDICRYRKIKFLHMYRISSWRVDIHEISIQKISKTMSKTISHTFSKSNEIKVNIQKKWKVVKNMDGLAQERSNSIANALALIHSYIDLINVSRDPHVMRGDMLYNTINWSPPSTAYMYQGTMSALVQVMVCCLIGAKLLPETMLAYCQLDSWKQISVTFKSKIYHFH